MQLAELLAGDPELDKLADDVICPVCLDLLHEPFQVPIASRICIDAVPQLVGARREVGAVHNIDEKLKISSMANPRLFLLILL